MSNSDKLESENAVLKNAWHDFCDDLKASGDLIFRDGIPENATTRAAGMRLLARNISLAMQFQMENNNPDFPELLHYFDPLRKQGGDNTDAHYSGAPINGQHSYRIYGNRGSAKYFAITILEDGNTPWGGGVVNTRLAKDLHFEADGSFELLVGPEKPADLDESKTNWMQTSADTYRITFRQFFADWLGEKPMQANIDCLTNQNPAPLLTPDDLAEGLKKSSHWVNWSSTYWADMIDKWKVQPNTFLSYGELEKNKIDFTPGGAPIIAYWQVPKDEVLVLRVTPPDASYWAVEFGNYWWETMDYRNRFSSTNCHHAELEDNGELIVVISHQDLGAKNWLDPSGHQEGYITYRWIDCDHYPKPVAEQMSLDDLNKNYAELINHIDQQQRKAQLRERRAGITQRFGS